ncbi:hypothetical protein SAMN05444142_11275 [Lutimaribacter pacificus]|uniref:Uncharacterized protein n=1 Tax=Lutimaribacter pacificus TaxID=391948 RepID=A0A1M6W8T3_9RHOB|nr:hypothetical protein [Lutimaribacter pacificus]SHK90220.1 hypothetical protein SAMN05444142_11275 [Lutimaribacter pacificus]
MTFARSETFCSIGQILAADVLPALSSSPHHRWCRYDRRTGHDRHSRPRIDGFGGGAHVLNLATGETLDWIYTDGWLSSVLEGRDPYA